MAASVASPIERQMSTIAGISAMTSSSSLGTTRITIQFDLNRDIDAAALDVQTALTIAQRRLPVEMTTPPSFRKVNPGRLPDPVHRQHFGDAAAVDRARICRHRAGAADFADSGRRAGAGLRRAEVRGARPGRPGGRRGARPVARRRAHRRRQGQFQRAGRHAHRSAPDRHPAGLRATREGGRLPQRGRCLAQRRPGQARRDRARDRQRREQQDRELVQRRAFDRARHPAPA